MDHKDDRDGLDIVLDRFRPGDAPGITALFREVYGEGYPIRLFYDPIALAEANDRGDYYSFVARTATGQVVAVEHLFRSPPYKSLYEAGAGLVLKDYRRLGLTKRLLHFIYDEWVPSREEVQETFGEAVCNHPHMQRIVAGTSHVELALEVALMPAEAYNKEKSASGRVAALLAFRCYRPKPHQVFLPPAYEDELRWLYEALGDARDLTVGNQPLPPETSTRTEMTAFDFAQVARIAVHQAGDDFPVRVHEVEKYALTRNARVIQVWLRLTEPWGGKAVEFLRGQGYFFGGVLPRWFDDDGLLMQKLVVPPDFEAIQLYSDRAKEILRIVTRDWSRTRK